jgi:hypothetical protein
MKNVSKKIKTEFDIKIALYHGGVFDAKTDIGYNITNRNVTTETFDGHDIALLGDIHMAQNMYIEKYVDENELEDYIKSGEWEIVEENP